MLLLDQAPPVQRESGLRGRTSAREYLPPPSLVGEPVVKEYRGASPASPSSHGGFEYALGVYTTCTARAFTSGMPRGVGYVVVESFMTRSRTTWWKNATDPRADVDVNRISESVRALLEDIHTSGARAVSLAGLDPQTGKAEHLVALLRASYPWKEMMPGWRTAEQRVRAALAARGVPVDKVMKGLDR